MKITYSKESIEVSINRTTTTRFVVTIKFYFHMQGKDLTEVDVESFPFLLTEREKEFLRETLEEISTKFESNDIS